MVAVSLSVMSICPHVPVRAGGAHLQDLSLKILQCLRLDTAVHDAGEAQQSHYGLHICALGNELLDSGQLCGDIIRSQEVCR